MFKLILKILINNFLSSRRIDGACSLFLFLLWQARALLNRLSMTCVRRSGSPGLAHFFLTSTRWLPMYENQNPATISRQKCYQMYLWLFQTSKMNFLPNDAIFYRSVPKVAYWWVEQHIKRSVSAPQPLQSYRMMKFHLGSKLFSYMRILLRKKNFFT